MIAGIGYFHGIKMRCPVPILLRVNGGGKTSALIVSQDAAPLPNEVIELSSIILRHKTIKVITRPHVTKLRWRYTKNGELNFY